MFTVALLLFVVYHTGFSTRFYADENVTRHWCLRIQEHLSKDSSIHEQQAANTTSILVKGSQVMINDNVLNQTILCDSSVAICTSDNTRGNIIWRGILYQVIIISSVFILSALSKKLAGSKTRTAEIFKRRNRFVEEIEDIKRWGNSMKPNVIVEQDWKIDWTSDIWLDPNKDVETSCTVLIHYKKIQVKTRDDHAYNTR
jgi:hypothetical protein